MRHRAALRHQRNAAWVQEIVDHVSLDVSAAPLSDEDEEKQSRAQLQRQLLESSARLQAIKDSVSSLQQSIDHDHQAQEELRASLHMMRTLEDVAACRQRVQQEISRHSAAAARDVKTIRL
ncbi:hypothetical protein ATCC90586_009181 [Pythium insidiosum]|nr:hypothetical protein ATCC90586_009181 [Pythium insidiosum]